MQPAEKRPPGLLDKRLPERQDFEELVADGLTDEANVAPGDEPAAEQAAMHLEGENDERLTDEISAANDESREITQ